MANRRRPVCARHQKLLYAADFDPVGGASLHEADALATAWRREITTVGDSTAPDRCSGLATMLPSTANLHRSGRMLTPDCCTPHGTLLVGHQTARQTDGAMRSPVRPSVDTNDGARRARRLMRCFRARAWAPRPSTPVLPTPRISRELAVKSVACRRPSYRRRRALADLPRRHVGSMQTPAALITAPSHRYTRACCATRLDGKVAPYSSATCRPLLRLCRVRREPRL